MRTSNAIDGLKTAAARVAIRELAEFYRRYGHEQNALDMEKLAKEVIIYENVQS